jgi:cytochrome c556
LRAEGGGMLTSFRLLALGAALAIGAATSIAALAQDKDKVIADRQDFMKKQIREWIVVRNYIQGNADQQAATAAVDNLVKTVPDVPKYFPPGTDGPAPDGKYGTKPEVWTQHDKFLADQKKVTEQVAALSAAIKSGDKAKTEVAFKDLDACNACHDTFRAKLQ